MRTQTEFQHLGHYWRKGRELVSTKPSEQSRMYQDTVYLSYAAVCSASWHSAETIPSLCSALTASPWHFSLCLSIRSVDKGQSGLWTRPVCLLETSAHSFYNKPILWSSNEASRRMSRWREDKRTKLIWSEIMHYPLAKRISNPCSILRVLFFVCRHTFISTSSVSALRLKTILNRELGKWFQLPLSFLVFSQHSSLITTHLNQLNFRFDMPPCYQMSIKPTQAIQ